MRAPLAVLVAVIGVLMALAVPSWWDAVQRGRQKRTMADLRLVGTAVEEYQVDHGFPPDVPASGMEVGEALAALLEPTFVRVLPRHDAWGSPFLWYRGESEEYSVVSAGWDGHLEAHPALGLTDGGFQRDIYFSSGTFTIYPDGTME